MTAPSPFFNEDFAENPSPRCSVVLLVDASSAMVGEPIRQLNEGLRRFAADMQQDELAQMRVDVAVIAFGSSVAAMNVRGVGSRSTRCASGVRHDG